jgi:hypothetical protein
LPRRSRSPSNPGNGRVAAGDRGAVGEDALVVDDGRSLPSPSICRVHIDGRDGILVERFEQGETSSLAGERSTASSPST